MSTSQNTSLITDVLSDQPLSPDHLGYLRGFVRNQAHSCVLEKFIEAQGQHGITKAKIARKLKKRPEVVTRELTAPGNWTLDTYGSYLLAMGYLPCFDAQNLRNPLPRSNRVHPLADGASFRAGASFNSAQLRTSGGATGDTPSTGGNSFAYVVAGHDR